MTALIPNGTWWLLSRAINLAKARTRARIWYRKNKERHAATNREGHLRRAYKLTIAEHTDLLVKQNGRCAICQMEFLDQTNIDHDHKTGKVRGLLCAPCNKGLGHFQDSSAVLHAAKEYLDGK